MQKAFIFDLDGVLIDDEQIWETNKQQLYSRLFGEDVHQKMGSTLGINMQGIYQRAVDAGTDISYEVFEQEFFKLAGDIYSTAPIPEGTDRLFEKIIEMDFRIGIVSASPLSWIMKVVDRLKYPDNIELIISLHERDDLEHKPHPAGYLEAMRAMNINPSDTFVLEDSNSGIKSAKESGAFTIGLRQNLVNGYEQSGADVYADTMNDVIEIVEKRISR